MYAKNNRSGSTNVVVIDKRAGNITVSINQAKIAEDAKCDGLKGYITNTTLSAGIIYEQYRKLWQVERAFRVTKGVLDIHPMFHFSKERIVEVHVRIYFVAYKVYKELERILNPNSANLGSLFALFI